MHADYSGGLWVTLTSPHGEPRHFYSGRHLQLKGLVAVAAFFGISMQADILEPFFTFLFLDILLSCYLFSLFRGRWRLLFLIHPFIVYIYGSGFQIPFTEIGTAFTYVDTFGRFVDDDNLAVGWNKLFEVIFQSEKSQYGFGHVYAGVLPIIWFPKFLFESPADITIYYSQSLWALLCIAIGVNVAMFFRVIRLEVLLIIALYAAVSPTFFDINSALHRYHLLFLGLFLFLIAYLGLTRKCLGYHTAILIGLLMTAILLVGVSKAPLLLSLVLFVILDFWVRGKLPILSSMMKRLNRRSCLILILALVVMAQLLSVFIVPEKYASFFSQLGGQYQAISNLPLIGLVLRLVYATLSPFPWINFSQWEIYGFNSMALSIHMLSALLASWIILSLFGRARRILQGADDIRACVTMGVAVMASLAFSAIGFHVYLAPALPFLATLLYEPSNQIAYRYPIIFLIIMEMIAQGARLLG